MIFKAHDGQQRDMRSVTVSLSLVASFLLCCRITSTFKNRGWLGSEDAFVIAANIFLIMFGAMLFQSTDYGFGMKVADIERTGGSVTDAMKYFWLTQHFYTLTNGFNKMAFLALYYRVFPMRGFRYCCLGLMGASIGWTVSYLFVSIFQCSPVPRVYDRTIPGTCINFPWHRWTNAVFNLLTDESIFVLPLPVIFTLNMSTGSRIGLVVLFSIGFFICLTTALRMATLPLTLDTTEPTWESAPTNLWSFVEAAIGVICACLISLRNTIGTLWPKKWRSNKGTSSGHYQQYASAGTTGNALGTTRAHHGARTGNSGSYALGRMERGKKGQQDTYASISPTESQERIIDGAKTSAHVTTSGRRSGSDDLAIQGITVTTDFKVDRGD